MIKPARRAARAALALVALIALLAAVPPARRAVLRGLGAALVASDPIEPGDVGVITETGGAVEFQAAEIELSDLYRQRLIRRAMVMRASPEEVDDELARRGVKLEDPTVATLQQLGIPGDRVDTLYAGEGGTTESTQALATWARAHPSRVVVVIGAAHARRYRRALGRVWPDNAPRPVVTYPHRTILRADDWWRSRRSLREGLFELQKLAWDYLRHPW